MLFFLNSVSVSKLPYMCTGQENYQFPYQWSKEKIFILEKIIFLNVLKQKVKRNREKRKHKSLMSKRTK